jgi:DNA-binding transcriptional ArsR family regulator
MIYPKLDWDIGTAYDLLISLRAIHQPTDYGLRASWAAGVRSRIPAGLREVMELAQVIMHIPLHSIYTLPAPKNADTFLRIMQRTPPANRLPNLFFQDFLESDYRGILMATSKAKKWTAAEKKVLQKNFSNPFQLAPKNILELLYKAWSDRETFGESLYQAFKCYVESYFVEEEQRILPSLKKGLAHAQSRAGSLPAPEMLEELSLGVRFKEMVRVKKLILAPSFWGSPFIFYERLDPKTMIMLFGARPDDMALVPGEVIPDSLLRALKAMADPTRLRILRYLSDGSQTPTTLAKVLRLRAPTVVHHLMALRMAGLVQVTVSKNGERHYSTRLEGFDNAQDLLVKFVNGD